MSSVYILFMQNLLTQEEFVASTQADSVDAAKRLCRTTYPANVYAILTCYAEKELETVMANLKRWPGVPSKVQAPLEELMDRVHVKVGGLPPLRKPQAAATVEQGARHVESHELSVMMRLMAEQNAARQARLDAALKTQAPARAVPVDAPAQRKSLLEALKEARGEPVAATPAAPVVQPKVAPQPSTNSGRSVVELLRGLRG